MDQIELPEGDPKAVWYWLHDKTQYAHHFHARRTREYCSWSHDVPYFHICACRKHHNGGGFLEGKKCSRNSRQRNERFCGISRRLPSGIRSEGVVEAVVQARKSFPLDTGQNSSCEDSMASTQMPREAHEPQSMEWRWPIPARSTSPNTSKASTPSSADIAMVSDEATIATTGMLANNEQFYTGNNIDLSQFDNLTIQTNAIPPRSNDASYMPDS